MQRRGPNLRQTKNLPRPGSFEHYDEDYAYGDEHHDDYMSTRNVGERIWIQVEIIGETIMDCLGPYGDALKRPLIIVASLALIMTLRSAKRGVNRTSYGVQRPGGPASLSYKTPPLAPSYVGGAGIQPQQPGAASAYQARNTLQQVGAAANPQQPVQYGQQPAQRGGLAGVAELVDMHGSTLNVVQPGLLKDFGGVTDFQGQIETVHGFSSAAVVEQVLQQPGQNKVLVVDGGGDLGSAIFDANMAQTAQRNGWKGVILHGAVRNAGRLASIPIGVKALGTNPIRGQANKGQQGAALTFGGVQINPGFWIYADRDGVVISEREISGASLSGGGSSIPGGAAGGSPITVGGGGAIGATNTYNAAPAYNAQPVGGLRGTAAAAPQQPQQYGAVGGVVPGAAPAYGSPAQPARPAVPAYARTQPQRAPQRPSYQYRGGRESANKTFLGKFVGMCFLFTSFMLMVKSVTG